MAIANTQTALLITLVAILGTSISCASFAVPIPASSTIAADSKSVTPPNNALNPKLNHELNPKPNHELIQQQVKLNTARLEQLEQANQDALARNQELQLMNDSLTVQVQVLQSERSAQMFLYGAVTLGLGAFIGFLLANFILSKNKRRW